MAIIKCKMCGGDLELIPDSTVAECEYCGSRQTVPTADNEKKLTLFARANRLRAACEFDKAAGLYESLVADFPEEAEAYWGLVLCKYGIEYVDDPATGKKIPTCHRSSFESVMEDSNFEQAMENADMVALKLYREEAKYLENLRKGILAVSTNEQPYDIFICYKETDHNGERTIDSLLAQDIYDMLTDKGYRVFFSRITLEDKLGQAYEPYIFAALNSAKIMLAVGTCYEYYNAVWVKNEWSRYLKIIAQDKGRFLFPCYKDIDPYDIPREFAHLQGQDMGKVGAMQDLLRGVEKILPRKTAEPTQQTVVVQQANTNAAPLLKRGYISLEDGDWKKADQLFEEVLNLDPECASAYIGKLLAAEKALNLEVLAKRHIEYNEQATAELLFAEDPDKNEERQALENQRLKAEEEAVAKYTIAGYLTTANISAVFKMKELKYYSEVTCREKQLSNEEAYWDNSREFNRALKYANLQEKKEIEDAHALAISSARERLQNAISNDEAYKNEIPNIYRRHIEEAKSTVEKMYKAAIKKQEEECDQQYKTACRLMCEAKTQEDFRRAKAMFTAIYSYRDSMEKAKECRKYEEEMMVQKKYRDALQEKIDRLTAERNQLGRFANKRRNEINAQIEAIRKELL